MPEGYRIVRVGDGIHNCAKPEANSLPSGSVIECESCNQRWIVQTAIKYGQTEGYYWQKCATPKSTYDPREDMPENPSYGSPKVNRGGLDYIGPYGSGTPFGS